MVVTKASFKTVLIRIKIIIGLTVKTLHYLFAGHIGPITGVDAHKASGIIDLSHLFLSCSLDWTVKLWSTKAIIIV